LAISFELKWRSEPNLYPHGLEDLLPPHVDIGRLGSGALHLGIHTSLYPHGVEGCLPTLVGYMKV